MRRFARRAVTVAAAIALGGGLSPMAGAPVVRAAAECGDYVWIGAAGSSERDGDKKHQNNGMGGYVNESYLNFKAEANARGYKVSHRALDYRARRVPLDHITRRADWEDFKASADEGVVKLKRLVSSVSDQCPTSKIVLSGYSQGAAVVHRAMQQIRVPRFAGAFLLADADRLTYDTVVGAGTAATPFVGAIAGQGVAQAFPAWTGSSSRKLPSSVGSKVLSYCDLLDPVCSYNPGASVLPFANTANHWHYDPTAWRAQFSDMILPMPKTAALKQFYGTWAGSVTEVGSGGPAFYGTLIDLRPDGHGKVGGTINLVSAKGSDGNVTNCSLVIVKSSLKGATLTVTGRYLANSMGCIGHSLHLTANGNGRLGYLSEDPARGRRATAILQRVL